MKKNVVFFGDSLTVGEGNNDVSFADYFSCNTDYYCTIYGVSGSCFGNYSIYPVENNLCDLVLDNQRSIENANLIVIEYGLNDTAAVATGYANFKKVCVSIVRSLDCIMQFNPNVNIIFVLPSNPQDNRFNQHMQNYTDYLNNDYFLNYSGMITGVNKFIDIYLSLVDFIDEINYNNVKVIRMPDLTFSDDGIHVNESTHRNLAKQLELFIRENNLVD